MKSICLIIENWKWLIFIVFYFFDWLWMLLNDIIQFNIIQYHSKIVKYNNKINYLHSNFFKFIQINQNSCKIHSRGFGNNMSCIIIANIQKDNQCVSFFHVNFVFVLQLQRLFYTRLKTRNLFLQISERIR